ncbi:PD-(D/E)XK nuclease family protein [Acinetobacter sp. ANC 4204]|uniref:PD-(D/E)XK nuclease family protein n=1 Tax=Acinetobacter sp. ANC 4204 TaxID=1977884 RepID=UPI00148A2422|nr:PD-(D/E)XK nuclease family protein [Acinetobacter sp. ANC 4204]
MQETGQLEVYKNLLLHAVKYHQQPREKTFFDTAIRKHYENPTTELLSFFLNPENEHGLGSVFFDGLTDAINALTLNADADDYGNVNNVYTELPTDSGKRIDLLIETDTAVFLIESKIHYTQNNPFDDYETHIAEKFSKLKPFKVVFCIDGKSSIQGWQGLSFSVYAEHVRTYLSHAVLKNPYNKWGLFAREFLMHLEHFREKKMNNEAMNFVQDSYKQISELIQLKQDFFLEIANRINIKLETSIENYKSCSSPPYTWDIDQQKYEVIDFSNSHWKHVKSSANLSLLIDTQPLQCSVCLFLHKPNNNLIKKVKEILNVNMLQTSNYEEFLNRNTEWWLGWERIPFEFDEVSNKIIEINTVLQEIETVWRNTEAQEV